MIIRLAKSLKYLPLMRYLNYWFFLKKGYSILIHVVPLLIAALLLLVLSVPDDNLLVKLAKRIEESKAVRPHALLLSIVASGFYILSIYADIRKSYLFPRYAVLRTTLTSFVFVGLCSYMAYVVLDSLSVKPQTELIRLWSCYLVAILSLTGIGWPTARSWVQAIGVRLPDYTKAHDQRKILSDVLCKVRDAERSTQKDIEDMKKSITSLRDEIYSNLQIEPDWEKQKICHVINQLNKLCNEIDKFRESPGSIASISSALNINKPMQGYEKFQFILLMLDKDLRLSISR